MSGRRTSVIVALKRREQEDRILRALTDNKTGLTSLQIKTLIGDRMAANMLAQLQKMGKIVLRKSMAENGRISHVYVLAGRR